MSQQSIWNVPGTVERLTELHEQKCSCSNIAATLSHEHKSSISRNAVIGKIHRLGLPPNRPNFQDGGAKQKRVRQRSGKGHRSSPPLRISAEPYIVRTVEAVPLHVNLLDLKFGQCRYPYGEGPYTFCAHEVTPGSSYCGSHTALCGQLPTGADRAGVELRKRAYARQQARAA